MEKLQRLWQPRNPLFWMALAFNVLSSVCAWALRALPLNSLGLLLIGAIGLLNVACGLWATWRLLQTPPAPPPAKPAESTATKPNGPDEASKPLI